MKNAIKWTFFIILIGIFAIDVAGLWKYKIKGLKNDTVAKATVQTEEQADVAPEEEIEIEYNEITSTTFSDGEKMFITNIVTEDEENYKVQGLKYKQYEVTKEEYNNLKEGKSTINIFGIEYSKDSTSAGNIILKSSDENAKSYYIKHDTKNKKYILMSSTTDYTVYESEEEYYEITVSGDLEFEIIKNGKTTESTVKEVAQSYNDIEIPEDTSKINSSEFLFNKKGVCTKITETRLVN